MTLGMVIVCPLVSKLLALFNSNPDVIAIGSQFLRIEVIAFNTYVLMGISNPVLQGLKRPKMIFSIGVTRQFILPILVFPFLTGDRLVDVWRKIVFIKWTAAIFSMVYLHLMQRKILEDPVVRYPFF